MPSLLSINDLSQSEILQLCQRADEIRCHGFQKNLHDKLVALLFFEPSTRTKMSFETASLRLGANILNFTSEHSSLQKGESLEDTIRMASTYADLIVIRHPDDKAALRASAVSSCPIINAGDGKNEHPTQTLLDIYTILRHNQLAGLTITLAGDLKYGRTIHSLIHVLKLFDINIQLISPKTLSLPDSLKKEISHNIILESYHLKDGLNTDFFYMTRVQKERISHPNEVPNEKEWILTKELCEKYAPPHMKILHPLPRVNEISTNLDDSPYALYFEQAKNGVFMRMALLEYALGVFSCT